MNLLDLPHELIHDCIYDLPIPDLARILKVGNSYLAYIILSSPTIRYRILQHTSGVYENPALAHLTAPIAVRRKALEKKEARWLAFTPTSYEDVPLPALWDDVQGYTVNEDSYTIKYDMEPETLLGGRASTLCLGRAGAPFWRELDMPNALLDFQLCPAADLLLYITQFAFAGVQRFQVHFKTISTGAVHPLATSPIIIADVPLAYDLPDLDIEVSGSTMVAAFVFPYAPDDDSDRHNHLHVFNWTSGERLITKSPTINTTAITFLASDALVFVDAHDNTLCVLGIPKPNQDLATHALLKFALPAIAPTHRMMDISAVCGDGVWTPDSPRLQVANNGNDTKTPLKPIQSTFLFDQDSSMFLLKYALFYIPNIADEQQVENGPQIDARVVMLARRSHLLRLFREDVHSQPTPDGPTPTIIPFEIWGPSSSRFFHLTNPWQNPCTSLAGQRFVSIDRTAASASRSRPAPIRIRDFNPATVRRVRALLRAGAHDSESDSESDSGGEGGALDLPGATVRLVEPDTTGGGFGFRCPGMVGRVVSELGYVEITSKARFPFHAVHMTNEHIVGDGGRQRQGVIGVLRFG
ncbi:hypothetical protein MKEN_00292100 [Mycena kentingensis (nom. inval.)]|nr:hypothetical protein MKEN_00292100 [Mycena kentingensis (nom. inval.)]